MPGKCFITKLIKWRIRYFCNNVSPRLAGSANEILLIPYLQYYIYVQTKATGVRLRYTVYLVYNLLRIISSYAEELNFFNYRWIIVVIIGCCGSG